MKFKFSRLSCAAGVALYWMVSSAFADTPLPLAKYVIVWDTPNTNEDGSPLTDLAGYYIYMGNSPETLVPYYFASSLDEVMVLAYRDGNRHYFGITAVNVEGVESAMSAIVGR